MPVRVRKNRNHVLVPLQCRVLRFSPFPSPGWFLGTQRLCPAMCLQGLPPSPHRGAPAARLSGSSLRFSHLHPHSRLKISSENIQILHTSASIFSPELLNPCQEQQLWCLCSRGLWADPWAQSPQPLSASVCPLTPCSPALMTSILDFLIGKRGLILRVLTELDHLTPPPAQNTP